MATNVEVHLVTGTKGTPHVSSADAGAMNACVFGRGKYLLNGCGITQSGYNFTIGAGDLMINGRHVRIPEPVVLTLPTVAQGVKRCDQIICRYEKQGDGTEKAYLTFLMGTAGSTQPSQTVPGDILEGAQICEMALYSIISDGSKVNAPKAVYRKLPVLEDVPYSADDILTTPAMSSSAVVDGTATELSSYGMTLDLTPGFWIVKGYLLFERDGSAAVPTQGVDFLQIYDVTNGTSRGTATQDHMGYTNNGVFCEHMFRLTRNATLVLRGWEKGLNGSDSMRRVSDGYIRAFKIG